MSTVPPGNYRVSLEVANPGFSDYLSKENYITATVNPNLVADFTGSPTYGTIPLSVQFTDLSTGNPTLWAWDFGDGQTSTSQNPFHTYSVPGTYTVGLTVQNNAASSTLSKPTTFRFRTARPSDPPTAIRFTFTRAGTLYRCPRYSTPGWNTFSIFSHVDTASHSIWQYDSANQDWIKKLPGDQVQPLYGYWIYSNSAIVIPLQFSTDPLQAPPTRDLSNRLERHRVHGRYSRISP